MISRHRAGAVSWILSVLAAIAFATGAVLTYAEHTVFRSDAFADRAAATLDAQPVRDAAARRLTDVVVGVRPDLVALRPIVELGARSVVGTAQFRSLVRRGALEAHRSAFDAHARGVTLQIRDAGLLVADVVERLRPGAAERMPTRAITRVARVKGGIHGFMLRIAERADRRARGKGDRIRRRAASGARRAAGHRLPARVGAAARPRVGRCRRHRRAGVGARAGRDRRERRRGRSRCGARGAGRVAGSGHGVGPGRKRRGRRGRPRRRRDRAPDPRHGAAAPGLVRRSRRRRATGSSACCARWWRSARAPRWCCGRALCSES